MWPLFLAEINEHQLPGQRVPQQSSDHHHEGAAGGQNRVRVLSGRTVGAVRFHSLLFVQVCHKRIGRSSADGGKRVCVCMSSSQMQCEHCSSLASLPALFDFNERFINLIPV